MAKITLFFSRTCEPCHGAKRSIALFKAKHAGVVVKEVDVDTKRGAALADAFKVELTPTLIVSSKNSRRRIEGEPSVEDLERATS